MLLNSNGHHIIYDNPKSWGVVLIVFSMFGFGNKFPDLTVAKTTSIFARMLRRINYVAIKNSVQKL